MHLLQVVEVMVGEEVVAIVEVGDVIVEEALMVDAKNPATFVIAEKLYV